MKASSWTRALVATSVSLAGVFLEVQEAVAQTMRWEQAPIYYKGALGCATAITVSANNDPVIIGCGSPVLFYTNPNVRYCPTGGSTCSQGGPNVLPAPTYPTWTPIITSTGPAYIADDLNGNLFFADTSGEIGYADGTGTGNGGFSGKVTMIPTTSGGRTGCITSLAVDAANPNNVVFDTPVETGTISAVWGVGCFGNPNAGLFELPIDLDIASPGTILGATQWQQLGVAQANAARQIALFSDLNQDLITQNPWVVAGGSVFYFNGSYFQKQLNAPAAVTYVTDHYILAGGNVYYWNGTADGGDNNGLSTWSQIPGLGASPCGTITQIAWSQAEPGTSLGTIGPSALWAIDTCGDILDAVPAQPPPK